MDYPSNCLRGIPNPSYFNPDGTVGSHLFYFEANDHRTDGWNDLSINWEDNDSVSEFTLSQKNPDGGLQFKGGLVVLPRDELDRLNNRPLVKGLLSYERDALPDNPFHGNLLLQANTSKPTMKLIAAGLALAVSLVIRRQ